MEHNTQKQFIHKLETVITILIYGVKINKINSSKIYQLISISQLTTQVHSLINTWIGQHVYQKNFSYRYGVKYM